MEQSAVLNPELLEQSQVVPDKKSRIFASIRMEASPVFHPELFEQSHLSADYGSERDPLCKLEESENVDAFDSLDIRKATPVVSEKAGKSDSDNYEGVEEHDIDVEDEERSVPLPPLVLSEWVRLFHWLIGLIAAAVSILLGLAKLGFL